METLQHGDLVEVVKYGATTDRAPVGMRARVSGLPVNGVGLYRFVLVPEDHATYWDTLPEGYRKMRDSESDRLEGWLATEDEIRKVQN